MRFSINIFMSLFILIFISACGGGGSASSSDPGISNFSATSTTIALGSSVVLTAEFVGGTGIINNSIGEITSGTTISVSPTTTTTYNLTVTNSSGSIAVTSFVTVTVVPSIIESFTATSATIVAGDSVDLSAVFITDGTGSIDNGIGSYTSNSTVTVSPLESTTYILTVTNSLGESVTAATTVTVVALNSLTILDQSLDQIFQVNQTSYTAAVGFLAKSIRVKATSADATLSINVNGAVIGADNLSQPIDLIEGADTVINIIVTQNTVSKTYTLTISRASAATFAEQAYLIASNTEAGDEFGYSVALSGDTLAVGAPQEDSGTKGVDTTPDEAETNSGAVYVFFRSGANWIQQAYIKASNSQGGDEFGISVALSGDTLVVGAIGEDSSSTGIDSTADELAANAGAVYVYIRNGGSWSEQAYIKASNTQGSDEFGISVALSDDTLAVGAHQEDSSTLGVNTTPDEAASNSGAVYIFTRSDSSWTQQAYIKASNTGGNDSFGYSIALSGDTLAVGAYREDSSTQGINTTPLDDKLSDDYGAVYVFVRNSSNWTEQAYIKASYTDKSDYFAFSVALSGDTLAVGAYLDDSETTGTTSVPNDTAAGANSGAVYVFARSNNTWNQQAYIKASNTGKTDLFGKSVALSGDILAVGATQEDSDIPGIDQGSNEAVKDFGAVYVYSRTGTSWIEQSYIKASTTISNVEFGHSVDVAGDTLAVGVPIDTTNAGAAYIFE